MPCGELPDYPDLGKVEGREAIVTMWKAAMQQYPGIIFVANAGAIVVTGDTATARSYTSEVFNDSAGGDEPPPRLLRRYVS